MNIEISEIHENITSDEYSFLREMLHEAVHVPEGEIPLPESIVDTPGLSIYISDWGREGDTGLIAVHGTEWTGAVWARIFPGHQKGYGFINSRTPELAIAVKKEYRNTGAGTMLLTAITDKLKKQGYSSVSLSVDKNNRALNLYRRSGFVIHEDQGTSYTMIRNI